MVEIAFQMKIKQVQQDMLVLQQYHKIKDLLIVYEGQLEISLVSHETNYKFELLSSGSSYGEYALLKAEDER